MFNLLGSLATPLIGLIMTPFYLEKIGLNGLGLIGLVAVVTTTLGVFIAGVSKTFQKEIATAHQFDPKDLRGIVAGGMLGFAAIALVLAGMVWILGKGKLYSVHLHSGIPQDTLARGHLAIVAILGLGVVGGALSSVLMAMRDQVWPNLLGIATAVATAVLTWVVLSSHPAIDNFYFCQLAGAMAGFLVLVLRFTQVLPGMCRELHVGGLARIWKPRLKANGKLSMVLVLHEGLGILITQIDRMLITAFLPLQNLGIYNIGAAPTRLVGIFTGPVNAVTYPEFCRLAGAGGDPAILGNYLGKVTFLMTLLCGCGAIILVPCAGFLLTLWLGAANVPPMAPAILRLLSLSQLLMGIAGPAYNLTVSRGRVGYGVYLNIAALIFLPLLGYWLLLLQGPAGVPWIWVIYAIVCIVVCLWIAYRRHAEVRTAKPWIFKSLLSLALAALTVMLLTWAPLEGGLLLAWSVLSSLLVLVAFMIHSFGFSLRSWGFILEQGPSPSVPICRDRNNLHL